MYRKLLKNNYVMPMLILLISISGCGKGEHQAKQLSPKTESPAQDITQLKGEELAKEDKTEAKQAKQGTIKVTFMEFGSVNCIPCKMMQPIMKEIEEEYKGQVDVVFYDVWTPEGKPYGQKYKIRLIPTQVFLDKDGKEYFRHQGFFPKDELVEVLKTEGVK